MPTKKIDPSCVIGKKYYNHIRRYQDGLSNYGGATISWVVNKGDNGYWVMYTWAECNLKEKDQFCKKTGREFCDAKFHENDKCKFEYFKELPTVNVTRAFVSDEYRKYKYRYDREVWYNYH